MHCPQRRLVIADTSPHVFVIDDDASVRQAVRRLVESVGLGVEAMGSAKEFLRITRPDVSSCIILDVRLPDMSEPGLQSELASNGTPIPVIFITAYRRYSHDGTRNETWRDRISR